MAKQVYLLVNTVYTDDDDPNAVSVLGTFETLAGATAARRKILQRQHKEHVAHLRDDIARARRGMAANPETPAQKAFFAAKLAWMANPGRTASEAVRLQKLAPTLGLAWNSTDHASDLASARDSLAGLVDFEAWLDRVKDFEPHIVKRTLR